MRQHQWRRPSVPPARAAQRPEFDDPFEQGTTNKEYLTRVDHDAVLGPDSEAFGQAKRQEALLEQGVDVSLDVKEAAKSLHRLF